jgi:hypothetical protein
MFQDLQSCLQVFIVQLHHTVCCLYDCCVLILFSFWGTYSRFVCTDCIESTFTTPKRCNSTSYLLHQHPTTYKDTLNNGCHSIHSSTKLKHPPQPVLRRGTTVTVTNNASCFQRLWDSIQVLFLVDMTWYNFSRLTVLNIYFQNRVLNANCLTVCLNIMRNIRIWESQFGWKEYLCNIIYCEVMYFHFFM